MHAAVVKRHSGFEGLLVGSDAEWRQQLLSGCPLAGPYPPVTSLSEQREVHAARCRMSPLVEKVLDAQRSKPRDLVAIPLLVRGAHLEGNERTRRMAVQFVIKPCGLSNFEG